MIVSKKDSGWRGSEELWLRAAYEMLIDSGVDAVKVMLLAKKLNLSRTSFYWHFDDREALLDALIRCWQDKNTGNLIAQCERYGETITEAVLNLFDCWIDDQLFDARLDFAIRNWAQQAPELKVILEKADQQRIAAIAAMFTRFGYNDEQADIRAHTIYYSKVGYISMMVDEPRLERMKRMPGYVETYTGHLPSDSEMKRFMSRHQVS